MQAKEGLVNHLLRKTMFATRNFIFKTRTAPRNTSLAFLAAFA
jgi:hypothetical protein